MTAEIPQATIDKLKAEHGKISMLTHMEHSIIVKIASPAKWKKFRDHMDQPEKRSRAMEGLIRDCCVYPDAEGLSALLDELPGLVETYASTIVEMNGMAREAEKKDL